MITLKLPGAFSPGLLRYMKKLDIIFALPPAIFLIVSLLASCQKGEDLPGSGYGQIMVKSTFSEGADTLLIWVDDVIKDTLSLEKPETLRPIILASGERKYRLTKLKDRSVLYEASLDIQAGRTTTPPPFLYDGTSALFDDLETKPAKDSLLVRFVNLNSSLPDLVNIKIILVNDETGESFFIKSLENIQKTGFGKFAQLPNPSLITQGASRFTVDIYDSASDEVVRTGIPLTFTEPGTDFTRDFIPNFVSSLAIKAGSRGRIVISPVFGRLAN